MAPKGMEATAIAFFFSMKNCAGILLSPEVANQINQHFIGVSTKDMTNYWKLTLTQLILGMVFILTLLLIPTISQI